jgi:hypothetical protein
MGSILYCIGFLNIKVRHAPFGHDSNRALFDFFHIKVFILDENFLHVAIFVFKLALYGNFVNKEN